MKLHFFLLLLCCLLSYYSKGEYGNEWIVDGQTYVKFETAQDGIYRVSYEDLYATLGDDLSSFAPTKMQLFHRGNEHALYYYDTNVSSVFDEGDYIEFYGKRNDGTLDAFLYEFPEERVNPYYNTYSDTTAFFLTWGTSNGKRINIRAQVSASNTIQYHFAEEEKIFSDVYSLGRSVKSGNLYFSRSEWSKGQGWHAPWTTSDYSYTFSDLNNVYDNGIKSEFTVRVATLNNGFYSNYIQVGSNQIEAFNLPDKLNAGAIEESFTIETNDISADGELKATVHCLTCPDAEGVAYMKVRFPQLLDMEGKSEKYFNIPSSYNSSVVMSVENVPDNTILYDMDDEANISILGATVTANTLTANFNANYVDKIYARDGATYLSPVVSSVSFNLNDEANDPAYLILTHKTFWDEALAYQSYRSTDYTTHLVDIDRLYNQYSYGEKNALAIYRFCQYMYDETSTKPEYLFMIGKGIDIRYMDYSAWPPNTVRRTPNLLGDEILDYIPAGGSHPSDMIYTMGLDASRPYEMGFAVGRLSVTNPTQVTAYLNKVKEHEEAGYQQEWRKNILNISGGNSLSEANEILGYMNGYKSLLETKYQGARVSTIQKTDPSQPVEYINISDQINEGAQILNIFGHSSASTNDIEIGDVANDFYQYENKGKYPFMYVNGCQWGDIYGYPALAESWVNTADKGAIATLASSHGGIPEYLDRFSTYFFQKGFQDKSFINLSLGKLHQETVKTFYAQFDPSLHDTHSNIYYSIITSKQLILQGDPAIKLFDVSSYDLALLENTISASSPSNESVFVEDDTLQLTIPIVNYGLAYDDSSCISIRKVTEAGDILLDSLCFAPVYHRDTVVVYLTNHQLEFGSNEYLLSVNSQSSDEDADISNDDLVINVTASAEGFSLLSPTMGDTLNSTEVSFVAQNNNLNITDTSYLLELDTSLSFSSPVYTSVEVSSGTTPLWSDVSLPITDTETTYYWKINYSDATEGGSEVSTFVFSLETSTTETTVMEAAINTSLSEISALDDDLFQADTLELSLAFEHLYGDESTDHLLANYLIVNQENANIVDSTIDLGSFTKDEVVYFPISFDTRDFVGTNTIAIRFNTDTSFSEDSYANNIFSSSFDVMGDFIPPIMSVTFDGNTITDGEVVRTNPTIEVILEDYNTTFLKTDMEGMRMQLKHDTCIHEDGIKECYEDVDENDITIVPATLTSDYQLIYQPDTLFDGTYSLRVFGEDAAGNETIYPYEISFEVLEQETLLSKLSFSPNPCTGDCQFSLVMQSEHREAETFSIQIIDMMGKVVKEVTIEATSLNIGWNTIPVNFDDVEEGLYHYRIAGNGFSSYTKNDYLGKSINKAFGKLYIVR